MIFPTPEQLTTVEAKSLQTETQIEEYTGIYFFIIIIIIANSYIAHFTINRIDAFYISPLVIGPITSL